MPPTLVTVFDRDLKIDVGARLAENQRLVSLSQVEIAFENDVLPNRPRPQRPSFSRWCEDNDHKFLHWGQDGGAPQLIVETKRFADFDVAVRKIFDVTAVNVKAQWMVVHTRRKGGQSWLPLERFVAS